MKWITHERPKIDWIACPWLIKNFIDAEAEFLYVSFDEVIQKANELQAIPYDIPGVEFTHYGDECTFDYFIRKYELRDPALPTMAVMVRGADTDRHHMASQSHGLWAISAGLSHITPDDGEMLIKGMMLYDALYAWSKFLQEEKHTQNSFEYLLLDVYEKFLEPKKFGLLWHRLIYLIHL